MNSLFLQKQMPTVFFKEKLLSYCCIPLDVFELVLKYFYVTSRDKYLSVNI
jgi:hypothetical protein